MKTEKQQHLFVFDDKGNPVAIVFFDLRTHDNIIYTLQKASEEEITALLTSSSDEVGKKQPSTKLTP